MARLASCPNCGAPLRAGEASLLDCPYCGSRIVLDPIPAAPRPAKGGSGPGALRWAGVGMIAVVIVIAGVSLGLQRPSAPAAPTPVRAPTPAVTARVVEGSPLAALGGIDVSWNVDAGKLEMPRAFPDATPDVHEIEYRIALAHPAFVQAVVVWEWGCNCLSHLHLLFREYPIRARAPERFVPCIDQKLGAPVKSQPPFRYEWRPGAQRPQLSLDQNLRVDLSPDRSQHGFRELLSAIDACGSGA